MPSSGSGPSAEDEGRRREEDDGGKEEGEAIEPWKRRRSSPQLLQARSMTGSFRLPISQFPGHFSRERLLNKEMMN